jgi:hypothetical protein
MELAPESILFRCKEDKIVGSVSLPSGEYSKPGIVRCLLHPDHFELTILLDRTFEGVKEKLAVKTNITVSTVDKLNLFMKASVRDSELIISLEMEQKYCHTCRKTSLPEGPRVKLRRCTLCRSACYCSKECQKMDWRRHKPQCLSIKALNDGETL